MTIFQNYVIKYVLLTQGVVRIHAPNQASLKTAALRIYGYSTDWSKAQTMTEEYKYYLKNILI